VFGRECAERRGAKAMMLIILSLIYAIIVAGDVWITLWAVKHGKGKEGNFMMKPFINAPIILIGIGIEIILFSIVVFIGKYYWEVLVFGIIGRGYVLINNINIVRRTK
jgi:hypothetical protein